MVAKLSLAKKGVPKLSLGTRRYILSHVKLLKLCLCEIKEICQEEAIRLPAARIDASNFYMV